MIKKLNIRNILILATVVLVLVFIFIEFTYIIVLLAGAVVTLFATFFSMLLRLILESYKDLFFWGPVGIGVILFTLSIIYRKKKYSYIFLNAGFIFISYAMVEKYLEYKAKHPDLSKIAIENNTPGFYQPSKYLGFKPTANFQSDAYEKIGDTLIFKVRYTIGENGLRITPECQNEKASSIVFFGCSFTFGLGLEDNQSLPYIIGSKVRDSYKAYNFGFSGYGTQQMLSALENNLTDSVIKFPPRYIIYTVMPDHISRAINLHDWNLNDPKYVLTSNGDVKCVGTFINPTEGGIRELMFLKFRESYVYKKLIMKQYVDVNDINLFIKMVKKSELLIKAKYPTAEFIVLYWNINYQESLGQEIVRLLKEEKITTLQVKDILPDWNNNYKKYQLYFPYDQHPNYIANKIISDYIIDRIIKQP